MSIGGNVVTNGTMIQISFRVVVMGKHMKSNKLRCQKQGKKREGDAIQKTTLLHTRTNLFKNRGITNGFSLLWLNFKIL